MHINIIFLSTFLFFNEIICFRGGVAVKPNEAPWVVFVRNSDQSSDNKMCNALRISIKERYLITPDRLEIWQPEFELRRIFNAQYEGIYLSSVKGQLISKGLFGVIVWTKNPTKNV